MKFLILLMLTLGLASCATRPDGTKTFAGLDTSQWGGVAVQTGTAYLDTRRQPVTYTNAKGVVEVQPEPEKSQSWLSLGLSLFGL